jgi:hypothetical protein
MLFAIPASTADDERVFSSAGITLSQRRSTLELKNFRMEHRIRTYLTAGAGLSSADGCRLRMERTTKLLDHLTALVEQRRNDGDSDLAPNATPDIKADR